MSSAEFKAAVIAALEAERARLLEDGDRAIREAGRSNAEQRTAGMARNGKHAAANGVRNAIKIVEDIDV